MKTLKLKKQLIAFTLVELLIVIAILALLMAYALPNYRDNVLRSKRTAAMNDLMQVSHIQERFYANKNRYGSAEDIKLETIFPAPNATNDRVYTVTMESTNTTYLITAKPYGGQAQDTKCPEFSINHLGKKLPESGCWD